MRLIESFFISKRGAIEDSEDQIVFNGFFAGVVDGASSQCDRKWNRQGGGMVAALSVCRIVKSLAPHTGAEEAVAAMTDALALMYRDHGLTEHLRENPVERAAASFAIFSAEKRQLWMVGDCQALLVFSDRTCTPIRNDKRVDQVICAARALFVDSELALGKTASQLQREDSSATLVQSLIARQFIFQNSTQDSEHAYSVIDGFRVSKAGIKVLEVPPQTQALVLGTDGYPRLFCTLEKTEDFRRDVIRKDPLLIRELKAVRAVQTSYVSYDDRAYLSLSLDPLSCEPKHMP